MCDRLDDVLRQPKRIEIGRQQQPDGAVRLGVGDAQALELIDGVYKGANGRERVGEDDRAVESA